MKLYRGGTYKTGMAFFTQDPKVASMYGKIHAFKTKKQRLRLFKVTHTSLKKVFKYLSENTRLLLKFIFGTNTSIDIQGDILKKLTGKTSTKGRGPGQRLSLTEIDAIAFRALCKEYVNKHGYDGIYVPPKFTKFHRGGMFHSEIFISRSGLLVPIKSPVIATTKIKKGPVSMSVNENTIADLFAKYTKGTRSLLKPFSHFVPFLGGGMAVKMYLEARGIQTAKTSDFDFKFAVPSSLKTQKRINTLSNEMYTIMYRHVSGFVSFLNRNGYGPAELIVRELKGVPIDKPGIGGPNYKKVYKVYNFSIKTRSGKLDELVDASLVVVPGITRRRHISLKWSRKFGFPIQTLTRLWKDTLYVLAGSFVHKKTMLRNPINGSKKEKGIKNAIRAGHLSYLTSKRRGTAHLVWLARKLIEDIAARDKKSGTKSSKEIMSQLKLMQLLNQSHQQ
jgi:hypothetical protein